MRYAVSAGAGSPEGEAYVQGLQGKLLFDLGRYGAAGRAYHEALAINPGYPPALAGIASVEAAGGELGPAIRHYRAVVERLTLAAPPRRVTRPDGAVLPFAPALDRAVQPGREQVTTAIRQVMKGG